MKSYLSNMCVHTFRPSSLVPLLMGRDLKMHCNHMHLAMITAFLDKFSAHPKLCNCIHTNISFSVLPRPHSKIRGQD